MSWHFYLMVALTIAYFVLDIYCYSTSITISYYSAPKSTWHTIKRKFRGIIYIIKSYFKWYGFGWFMIKHTTFIWIAWLIYGGIFIW